MTLFLQNRWRMEGNLLRYYDIRKNRIFKLKKRV